MTPFGPTSHGTIHQTERFPIGCWTYQAKQNAREAHHKIIRSMGEPMYHYLEDAAHEARDGLVSVLEKCGVRFTDEGIPNSRML
jgi:hypothetical protein